MHIILLLIFAYPHVVEAIKCGRPKIPPYEDSKFKITGGRAAKAYSWPWQVYITACAYECSGSLISRRYIVTVGHCLWHCLDKDITIKLGVFNLEKPEEGSVTLTIPRDKIPTHVKVHPAFHGGDIINDIAYIELMNPINFTDHISPVCLPRNDSKVVKVGKEFYVTGWGMVNGTSFSDELRQVQVPIRKHDQEPGCPYEPFFVDVGMICAGGGGHPVKKGACHGDSGDPFVRKNKKRNVWYQYGIMSNGKGRCQQFFNYGEIYTRMAYYCRTFIEHFTGKKLCRGKDNDDEDI